MTKRRAKLESQYLRLLILLEGSTAVKTLKSTTSRLNNMVKKLPDQSLITQIRQLKQTLSQRQAAQR